MLLYIDIVFRNEPKKVHYVVTPVISVVPKVQPSSLGNETSYKYVYEVIHNLQIER
jgi:hypothetical protein